MESLLLDQNRDPSRDHGGCEGKASLTFQAVRDSQTNSLVRVKLHLLDCLMLCKTLTSHSFIVSKILVVKVSNRDTCTSLHKAAGLRHSHWCDLSEVSVCEYSIVHCGWIL